MIPNILPMQLGDIFDRIFKLIGKTFTRSSMLGMVFGYFAYRSKSLLPSMAAHCTNNFVVILISFIGTRSRVANAALEKISLTWVIASFAICAIILYTFQNITSRNFPEEHASAVAG